MSILEASLQKIRQEQALGLRKSFEKIRQNTELANLIKSFIPPKEELKGDKGDKGDLGPRGHTGRGEKGDKGDKGDPGSSADLIKPEEIRTKLESLGLLLLSKNDLESIIRSVVTDNIKVTQTDKGVSIVQSRRSHAYFKPLTITGTKNGSNKEFYLSEAPRFGSQIFIFMNGQWLSNNDYTITTGQTLTLGSQTPAPESNWNFYAIAFKP